MQPNETTRPFASDDPRHGTYAGYVAHAKAGVLACDPCRDAQTRYTKQRKYERHNGQPRLLPIIGYRRRFEALQTLGWSIRDIGTELGGVTLGAMSNRVYRSNWISVENYRQMDELYERVCMTPRFSRYRNRTIRNAARKGYAPPLAWDDIDDPDETPKVIVSTDEMTVDEIKVERVLDGIRQDCNQAERMAVVEAWTGSLHQLEQITGWNVRRIARKVAA